MNWGQGYSEWNRRIHPAGENVLKSTPGSNLDDAKSRSGIIGKGGEVVHSNQDPIIQAHRAQIAELDLRVLEALNARIGLVRRLKEHKEAQGISFFDAAQEDRLLAALRQANRGPLPDEGLDAIFRLILAWTRRAASGEAQAD
ncbi:MAG: chorismate mutase [Geothrix sp.]|nr:chorismate mutase [Geothrix sp.]NWJ40258.1 chorismate mutase [Geothrix sp.]